MKILILTNYAQGFFTFRKELLVKLVNPKSFINNNYFITNILI